MKTYDEKFHDVIDMVDGTCVLNKAVYKQIQADVLKSCIDLCQEGVKMFEGMNQKLVALGCKECMDNIKLLAKQEDVSLL